MRVPARGRPHCLHRCSRRRNGLLENLFFLIKMEKTGLEIVSVEEVNETSPAYEKCPWISQVGFHSFFSFFFIFENQTAALRALAPGLFRECTSGERNRRFHHHNSSRVRSDLLVGTCPNKARTFIVLWSLTFGWFFHGIRKDPRMSQIE